MERGPPGPHHAHERTWRSALQSGLGHGVHDPAVATVDVVAERDLAVGAGRHGAVGHIKRHRLGKAVVRLLTGVDHLAHALLAEAAAATEHFLGEVERVLQADAAMTEIAA